MACVAGQTCPADMSTADAMFNPNQAEAAAGRYRADIDGLRALAVLPVVFYHFGVTAPSQVALSASTFSSSSLGF